MDISLAIGWFIFAAFGVVFWFWPFLISYYMYEPIRRLPGLAGRAGGLVYGAAWHAVAHMLLVQSLGVDPWSVTLLMPALVGGLWGSWLPAGYRGGPRE
jgi:hypothetical protein